MSNFVNASCQQYSHSPLEVLVITLMVYYAMCVLLARWCPCLQWSCCRGSTWERLKRFSGRFSPPTQRERRCRRTGKATLQHGSHEQYTSGLLKLYSCPVITKKDILRAEQTIQSIVSDNVYMMMIRWRCWFVDLCAIHKRKFLIIIFYLFFPVHHAANWQELSAFVQLKMLFDPI